MNETMTYADAFTRAFAREPEFLTSCKQKRLPAALLGCRQAS